MKIVLTKAEFADLVRECEHHSCGVCPLMKYCYENSDVDREKKQVENICEIRDKNDISYPFGPNMPNIIPREPGITPKPNFPGGPTCDDFIYCKEEGHKEKG